MANCDYHIDFETYSEADIRKIGAWQYSKHPTTEILCMAYALDDGKPELWKPGMKFPFEIFWPHNSFHAWNSFFEYSIWLNVLKRSVKSELPPISNWHDTAAQASVLALPRKLIDCGTALGLPQDQLKNKRGVYLVQKLCKPRNWKGTKTRCEDPELLEELYEYCKQDVIAEREIKKIIRPLNEAERKVWELDQEINLRGVPIDTESVGHAIEIISKQADSLNKEVFGITDGELLDVNSWKQVIPYCAKQGFHLDNYQEEYLKQVLKKENPPKLVKRLLQIRQQTGKTSNAKYAKLKLIVDSDERARGLLRYHGASTGRWSGNLFQPHNLPRPSFKDTDECIELFRYRDQEILELFYGDPMEALSSCIRGMICAPEGMKLMVADFSSIEARALAWLADQKDILKVFRGHGKIYEHTASKIYGKPFDSIEEDSKERLIGKVATLALGYGGGIGAFQTMAPNYGLHVKDSFADKIKNDWRGSNFQIVNLWKLINQCAVKAVQNPGTTFSVKSIKFCYIEKENFLFCRLPSGRLLAYYGPELENSIYGYPQVTYMGVNSLSKKWERQQSYGGKWVENIIQALCRDLMVHGMMNVEKENYQIILTVHDEILALVPENFGSLDEYIKLMCELPNWAEGLPIDAKGYEKKRFRK